MRRARTGNRVSGITSRLSRTGWRGYDPTNPVRRRCRKSWVRQIANNQQEQRLA